MTIIDEFSLRNCRAVVADTDPQGRHRMRSDLYVMGFRQIDHVADYAELSEVLETTRPDLIVADMRLEGGEVSNLIRDIRHHQFEGDPFVPVIVTADKVSPDLVNSVISSGADHFLVKPWDELALEDRIKQMIFSRKPFVVTFDYIGPDRRATNRDGDTTPKLAVPNPLHSKVIERKTSEDYQRDVDHHRAVINERKLLRGANQVLWIANKILPVYSGGTPDQTLAENLEGLEFTVEDMIRRVEGTPYQPHAESLGRLLAVVENLRRHYNTPDRDDVLKLEEYSRQVAANIR